MTHRRVAAALEVAKARGETGVQVAAYLHEDLIVDAWIGTSDGRVGRPVDGETLFPSFSVAKGVTSTAVHVQAERGLVDLGAPIATYWPEFAAHGKETATVEDALSHRLGVPQMPEGVMPERLGDWDWIVSRIADLEPLQRPGTVNSYHPLTFGWVLGEVVRRTDPLRRPFGQFVREELCEPLEIDSLWLGVPEHELGRVARLETDGRVRELPPERVALRAKVVPPAIELVPDVYNRADVLQACIPATGLTTNARSLARFFALLANGGKLGDTRLLSEERVRSFTERRACYEEADRTNFYVMPLSSRGYWLDDVVVGGEPNLVCNVGAGGAIAWANLDTGIAVAICHNRMFAAPPGEEHPLVPLGAAVREIARDLAHAAAS